MYFLSDREEREWRALADDIHLRGTGPEACPQMIRPEPAPAFHFYIATFLATHGKGDAAIAWAKVGAGSRAFHGSLKVLASARSGTGPLAR